MSALKLNYNVVAREVRKRLTPIMHDGAFFYTYKNGVWRPVDNDFIKCAVKRYLRLRSTQRGIEETFNNLKLDCRVAATASGYTHLLNVRNGMLDLKTFKLLPHGPSYHSTIQLGVSYRKEARCPKWLRFVGEVLEQDDERDFLQEFVGYLLIPDVKLLEACAIFLGTGANGKSTTIRVIEQLVGVANRSTISLDLLDNSHYRMELYGKLLNLSWELHTRSLKQTDWLKRIISGEPITADRKYGHPMTFVPYARLLFAMNKLPAVHDTTHAFFRRLVILPFNRRFEGDARNPRMADELIKELDGIFRWALDGLRRLQQRGHFECPASSQHLVEQYRQEANSVVQFVHSACRLNHDARTQAGPLYQAYTNWCRGYRVWPPASLVEFFTELVAQFDGRVVKRPIEGRMHYQGIALLENEPWKAPM